MYRRLFTPAAAALLKKTPPTVKAHLRRVCDDILKDPFQGKPLCDDLQGFYSWRHTRYRVLYRIEEKTQTILIEYLGPRGDVYRLFADLKRRKG